VSHLARLSLVALAVLALVATGTAAAGSFPTRGKVVLGTSIAGIKLGETQTAVKSAWGPKYDLCTQCKDQTWLYEYQGGEPLGAAVRFEKSKVVAVFTLGSPAGWGTKGLMMGDPLANIYSVYANINDVHCIGYDALTVKVPAGTMAFYSAAGVIYGYALTAGKLTPCQ
jgi:hypothetical protein